MTYYVVSSRPLDFVLKYIFVYLCYTFYMTCIVYCRQKHKKKHKERSGSVEKTPVISDELAKEVKRAMLYH